jgi:hypothetical protein
MVEYIKPNEFRDFCTNQEKLIELLNHRMTKVEEHLGSLRVDIATIKTGDAWRNKILWLIFGGMVATFLTLIARTFIGL